MALNGQNERHLKSAIYIRVSTTYQVDKDSLPMQRNDLIAYTQLILGIPDYEIFEDAGYSGKNTDRPAFQEMMNRIRKGEFSHVLVWKIDRISRNLLDFAQMYQELRRLHVTFVSKNEQFDTSTAMGEAMLKIILVFAELERNMTSERVTATMISRANSGVWNGGRIPYGYNYNKESGTFSINEPEAKICRELCQDYLANKSLLHTAKHLNEKGYKTRSGASWTAVTVWKIASSPFYCGTYCYNQHKGTEHRTINPQEEWVMVRNHHPAIFSEAEHLQMKSLRENNSRSIRKIGQSHIGMPHVFSGLVYCGKCGSRMVSSAGTVHAKDGYKPTTYTCPLKRKARACDNTSMSDSIIGEFTINYILAMLNAKKNFSNIKTPEALEQYLLQGKPFKNVAGIETDGLNEFYNLLTRYKPDNSFKLHVLKSTRKQAPISPAIQSLHKEKEKQERALKRLQDLYLYSDTSMSEKDFIIRKNEITDKMNEINSQLGIKVNDISTPALSDEEFIKKASNLLISKYLADKEYIKYRDLAVNTSPDVLHTYMTTVIEKIVINGSRITSITFKNGMTHTFLYH